VCTIDSVCPQHLARVLRPFGALQLHMPTQRHETANLVLKNKVNRAGSLQQAWRILTTQQPGPSNMHIPQSVWHWRSFAIYSHK